MKNITGIWVDPKANLIAWGRLYLTLNQDAVVISLAQVAPRNISFQLDASGRLQPGAKIWGNDELAPAGTYYTLAVTAFGGGVVWGPVHLMLVGADPINITGLVPMVVIPVTPPTPPGPPIITGNWPPGSTTGPTITDWNLSLVPGSNISFVVQP